MSSSMLCLCYYLIFCIHVACCVDLCGSPGWSVPPAPNGLSLKHVTAVIRHGDRVVWNGSQCWPGDQSVWNCDLTQLELPSYLPSQYIERSIPRLFQKVYLNSKEEMPNNCSLGQLTTKGYKQHVANGGSLHNAYIKNGMLAAESLDQSEIYIRSDDVPRTLQSAQALVMGMFPTDPNVDGKTTPTVLIHTRDAMYDSVTVNSQLCPKASTYVNKFKQSDVWSDHAHKTRELIEKLQNSTGLEITVDQLEHFADCLCTHYCHNMSLPKGLTKELYDAVSDEMAWQFYALYKYPTVEDSARVGIGFLLKDIWKHLNASAKGEKNAAKFVIISGHDTTLMPLLVALRIDEGVWPEYASMMLIELYEDKNKMVVVRVVYNGKVISLPFCGGKETCDYEQFNEYISTVTPPDNYVDFCKA